MSILIFILVLGALIFVHELGHFLVAKKSGIRVDEFAIGFPPRIFGFKKGETTYALNLIPFGGYVKIFGENPEDGSADKSATDSMVNKPKYTQALVLVAGIVFNVLFAALIFFFLFVRGVELNTDLVPYVDEQSQVQVQYVEPGSLADRAGIKVEDTVTFAQQLNGYVETDHALILDMLYAAKKEQLKLGLQDAQGERTVTLSPATEQEKFGMSLTDTTYVKANPIKAIEYSFYATGHTVKMTAVGLGQFFGQVFVGKANLKEVAGPVGIVGLVDQAAQSGLNQVLLLAAIISVNLAVLNVLPFPALDGGRLVIVLIEAIRRKDLDYKKVAIINLLGFVLLIGLMIVLTVHDVQNLFK